jgi:hypothetical protein
VVDRVSEMKGVYRKANLIAERGVAFKKKLEGEDLVPHAQGLVRFVTSR